MPHRLGIADMGGFARSLLVYFAGCDCFIFSLSCHSVVMPRVVLSRRHNSDSYRKQVH